MLNPIISFALQLQLSVTGSTAQRLQSALYYKTCEWRFDLLLEHFPFEAFVEAAKPFSINHKCQNEPFRILYNVAGIYLFLSKNMK